MRKITFSVAWLICLLCAGEWFFRAGVRLYFYELLAALFLCLAAFSPTRSDALPGPVALFIRIKWIWLLVCAVSGLLAGLAPLSYSAPQLFFKAFLQALLYTSFFSCFAIYFCSLPARGRATLANAYILGVVLCAVYGVLQAALYKFTGFDLDSLLWAPFNVPFSASMGIASHKYGHFYRIKGWTSEADVFANYIVPLIPMAAVMLTSWKRLAVLAVLSLGIFLSASLNGIGGMLLACIALLILTPSGKTAIFKFLLLCLIPFAALTALFPSSVLHVARTKLSPEGTIKGHLAIVNASWKLAAIKPTGWGFGNYSAAYEHATSVQGFNASSSWMTHLIEGGFFGLFFQASVSLFLLWHAARRRMVGKAFAAGYFALCVTSVFYNVLDSFSSGLFLMLFFSFSLSDSRPVESGADRTGAQP